MKKSFFVLSLFVLFGVCAAWAVSAETTSDPFASFPAKSDAALSWTWEKYAPYFDALDGVGDLNEKNIGAWLSNWTRLADLLSEVENLLSVATAEDTANADAEKRYNDFLENVKTPAEERFQALRSKLLASSYTPKGFELPYKKMRIQAELFRKENLPLFVEQEKLNSEYNKILGAQSVMWDGKDVTLAQLDPVYIQPDRARREKAWKLSMNRWLKDRAAIGELWKKYLPLRLKMASNAGFPDYRAYKWKEMMRLDYTPEQVMAFHENIRRIVVPAAERIYEKRRKRLGLQKLRPWDLTVDPLNRPALHPFDTIEEFEKKSQVTFDALDPALGKYFETMRTEKLLDLGNRKNKAPGGFCAGFDFKRRPFIFMNAVGVEDDVLTILHEGGHAFHYFEASKLPWTQQRYTPMEFDEVASMSMELLAGAYLHHGTDGFYSKRDAARARIETLEGIIVFWPYMSVVDSFQHWVYQHPKDAADPRQCDRAWANLWKTYMKGVDWTGFKDTMETGWQRKLHIHTYPFYYIEYGIAELGAVQVFGNAKKDPKKALEDYRHALSLGGTASLPELFAAAGAKFSMDEKTLGDAVTLIEQTIDELEKEAAE